jgi:hypothetical protein
MLHSQVHVFFMQRDDKGLGMPNAHEIWGSVSSVEKI